mgnify:CR=1 FL=1
MNENKLCKELFTSLVKELDRFFEEISRSRAVLKKGLRTSMNPIY